MDVSGNTQSFGVLGHPVKHTLSPPMHNAALQRMGRNAVYLPYDVEPEHVLKVLESMRHMGFGGVNLTIPHKEVAFSGLADLAESARLVGAVNTVEFTEDGLVGHSTDGYGIVQAIQEGFDTPVRGAHIAVVGCGGAGRSIALVCATEGARAITLWNRNRERAETVAAEIRRVAPHVVVDIAEDDLAGVSLAEIVIQSTSLGMKPDDESPVSREVLRPEQKVIDTIYVFEETAIMREARAAGAQAINGLGMLLHQGVQSLRIWTGEDPPVEVMREALRRAVYEKE